MSKFPADDDLPSSSLINAGIDFPKLNVLNLVVVNVGMYGVGVGVIDAVGESVLVGVGVGVAVKVDYDVFDFWCKPFDIF